MLYCSLIDRTCAGDYSISFSIPPQAWSNIVHLLIPNVHHLESGLSNFASILDSDEVLLFERATFLVREREHNLLVPCLAADGYIM